MSADLSAQTFVITGANAGIGKATATALAHRGATVYLACRSQAKTEPVVSELRTLARHDRVHWLPLDLASFASIRQAADRLSAQVSSVTALINNAGVAGKTGLTTDGFELTFGTNHVGHFLWTRLLLPLLAQQRRPARIINVASAVHYGARRLDLEPIVRRPAGLLKLWPAYVNSKVANVLFTSELARRCGSTGITTYAVHPGFIASEIWRHLPPPLPTLSRRYLTSTTEGAVSSIHAATAPELGSESGNYYNALGQRRAASELAQRADLAAELWQQSSRWVNLPVDDLFSAGYARLA